MRKRVPFYCEMSQKTIVDALCVCGRRQSDHMNAPGEHHGGGCAASNCDRFSMLNYLYEEPKVYYGVFVGDHAGV
jgi:hypothetical protein